MQVSKDGNGHKIGESEKNWDMANIQNTERKTTMEKIREKVTKVLESGLSSYEIAKETGIQISSLSKYRNSKYCLDNMTLSIAEKLAGFYDKNHKREGFTKK